MLKLNNIENENAGYEIISVGLTVIKQKKKKRKKEIETRKKSVNWTDLSKKKKKKVHILFVLNFERAKRDAERNDINGLLLLAECCKDEDQKRRGSKLMKMENKEVRN